MYFTVEEENLICLYHNADRRRTATLNHRHSSEWEILCTQTHSSPSSSRRQFPLQ